MLRPRILLAEESPLNRGWLHAALSRLGGTIEEVADVSELLSRLSGGSYDLVVCPRNLGATRGEQLLAMTRTAGLRTPFLLVAPVTSDRTRALVSRLGPASVLDDPLDATRLHELAEKLLPRPAARASAAAPPSLSPE